ncbi:hypothetical protein E2C01_030895 [Portunus trituberculatus]|uniref:Secreted protein n=1 Tax=Portunus trituberculatus TaxID=210409 RepID=A0A5B7EW49_PORTR|nr:hypothetical protein [Portunus trituberculatus]
MLRSMNSTLTFLFLSSLCDSPPVILMTPVTTMSAPREKLQAGRERSGSGSDGADDEAEVQVLIHPVYVCIITLHYEMEQMK